MNYINYSLRENLNKVRKKIYVVRLLDFRFFGRKPEKT